MPRPVKCRKIGCDPEIRRFKPAGIPSSELESVTMSFDEFEAIRLADAEGLYQDEAAKQMQVSRQTFGNILASARRKVGEMLISGKLLTVTGGNIEVSSDENVFGCATCGHESSVANGMQPPEACPSCRSDNMRRRRATEDGERGRRGRCRKRHSGSQNDNRESGIGATDTPDHAAHEDQHNQQSVNGENV
jgi:predicted DNA-binding protein (UPF0251 family)